MTPIAQLKSVSKTYEVPGGSIVDILCEVDFTIHSQERIAIIGRSGSGKSTLLNILGLLEQPSAGSYMYLGREVAELGDVEASRIRGSDIGFVFQQFHLIEKRTALQNVAEPLLFGKASERKNRFSRASHLLSQLGLEERELSMPHLLSGGERQRVAIARALVRKPKLILADEPTGYLDTLTGERVMRSLLEAASTEEAALVLVTHDEAVAAYADRVLRLENGSLREIPE